MSSAGGSSDPRNYIAQAADRALPLSLILRGRDRGTGTLTSPYILVGSDVTIIPGALTRVALRRGSYVVNSSQGGGSKDTWVLRETAC